MSRKIAFIGAGSFGFTRALVRDILSFPAFSDATIALMDIDPERLDAIYRACKRIAEEGKYPAKVIATMDRKEALLDADEAQISSYQAIVTAYEKGTYVSSVEEIMDGGKLIGYRISFVDETIAPIEIMNGVDGMPGSDGEDGYTPQLDIALSDGRYYWTVDGQIRLDMPASPDAADLDVKNGETPQILIEDGNWVMVVGEVKVVLGPVSSTDALVSDDLFGNVEVSDDVLKVTMANGPAIELPVLREFSVSVEKDEQDNVIRYVLSASFDAPIVSVLCPYGWSAVVEAESGALTGRITLTMPENIQAGDYTFNVLVTDGRHSASTSFTVTVNEDGGVQ